MQAIGEVVHTFLGADDIKRDKGKRLTMAGGILKRWNVVANLTPETLLLASDRLYSWVGNKWPGALWHSEYPVSLRQENGTIVSGFIDLLLETSGGYIIIDHKSFPGSVDEAKKKAAGFSGQIGVYAEAVRAATGKEVLSCYIHLPMSASVVQIELE